MGSKTCVVTGSSKGIRCGIAGRFGEEGREVAVNYQRSEAEGVMDVNGGKDL